MDTVFVLVSETNGLYKIGYARNLESRVQREPSHFQLVGTLAGGRDRAKALHREFQPWALGKGSWLFALPKEQQAILLRRLGGEMRVVKLPRAGKRQMQASAKQGYTPNRRGKRRRRSSTGS